MRSKLTVLPLLNASLTIQKRCHRIRCGHRVDEERQSTGKFGGPCGYGGRADGSADLQESSASTNSRKNPLGTASQHTTYSSLFRFGLNTHIKERWHRWSRCIEITIDGIGERPSYELSLYRYGRANRLQGAVCRDRHLHHALAWRRQEVAVYHEALHGKKEICAYLWTHRWEH